MKDEEICQRLIELSLAEGATDAVAFVTSSEEGMVRFSNNVVTVYDTLSSHTGSLFVKVESRKASVDVVDLKQPALRAAAKRAVETARKSPLGDIYAPLPQGPFQYRQDLVHQPLMGLEPETMVDWVGAAIDAGRREGAERMAGSLTGRNVRYSLATSGGVASEAEGGSLELSVRAFGQEGGSGHAVALASDEREFRPEEAGAEAGRYARMSAHPTSGEPGEYEAVLGPLVFADIINQVGRMSSAFYVDAGLSFLTGKLGERVGSEHFNLEDDPSLARTYGSAPFDAEGLPSQRTTLVERGILKSYLHNSTTAKKFGTTSTANAGLVAPRPYNLVVGPGTKSLEDLVATVDDGILVTNNWYLRYQNYSLGDFSTIPRDAMFRVRRGEIVGPIKELRMSENMLSILRGIEGLTMDRRWVKWWEVTTPTLAPAALIRKMRFTRSEM